MKRIVKKFRRFFFRNKKFAFIGAVVIFVPLFLFGTKIYQAGLSTNNQANFSKSVPTPTLTPTTTPTPTPIPTRIPTATRIPLPTATPTMTPMPTEDPTKGAIKVRLLKDGTEELLKDVSVNITIKKGDFSSTKSGAEVYFDNLEAGQEYRVYVDYLYSYNIASSDCGSGCYVIEAFPGTCAMRLPAKVPSGNQEVKCTYRPLNP